MGYLLNNNYYYFCCLESWILVAHIVSRLKIIKEKKIFTGDFLNVYFGFDFDHFGSKGIQQSCEKGTKNCPATEISKGNSLTRSGC